MWIINLFCTFFEESIMLRLHLNGTGRKKLKRLLFFQKHPHSKHLTGLVISLQIVQVCLKLIMKAGL